MPKYKYVDGVKYRVVPQSVLGYALVREGSDNSLPTGGTEGQVLTKASNTDYDVEWSTVESGSDVYYVDFTATSTSSTSATTETTLEDITAAFNSGKRIVARVFLQGGNHLIPLEDYVIYNNLIIPRFFTVCRVTSPDSSTVDILTINIEPNQDLTWAFAYKYWHVSATQGS